MENQPTVNTGDVQVETKPVLASGPIFDQDSDKRKSSLGSPRVEVKLSPEVTLNNNVVYVIRADTNDTRKGRDTGEVCFVFEEKIADHILESLAKQEVKNLSANPNIKIFIEIHTENVQPYVNKKIHICTQSLGYLMNGSVEKIITFGYTKVACGTFKDSLTPSETKQSQALIQSPEERKCEAHQEESTGSSQHSIPSGTDSDQPQPEQLDSRPEDK